MLRDNRAKLAMMQDDDDNEVSVWVGENENKHYGMDNINWIFVEVICCHVLRSDSC